MNRWKRNVWLFGIGAAGYSLIEIAFRGHTHWTMSLTGGCCAMMLYRMHRKMKERPVIVRCGMGALIITMAELGVGIIVNRVLGWNVWDYSDRYLNVMGQICPLFSLYWFLLNWPLIPLFDQLEKRVFQRKEYRIRSVLSEK